MIEPADNDWRDLFASPRAEGEALRLRVARRHGADWLILPASAALAARSLALYPAQTARARWARRALALALRLGLKPGLQTTSVAIAANDPFVEFLRATARLTPTDPLRFAVLAGNPNAPGRRFVMLLFGADGEPAAVVKAGAIDAARRLLASEEEFLRAVAETRGTGTRVTRPSEGSSLPGVPGLRGAWEGQRVRALALDFFPGDSPGADDIATLSQLLGGWLTEDRRVTLGELPAWRRLLAAEPPPGPRALFQTLGILQLHPTVAHGDLAPWNIKSAGGHWTALDWERGELNGVPGWDWLHYVLQPALLVRREGPAALLRLCEATLNSPAFKAYATRAGIAAQAPALAVAYLFNCLHVTRQTEGREHLQALLELALPRWSRPH